MPGRLAELLYTAYLFVTGLPSLASAAHREGVAIGAAARFHPGTPAPAEDPRPARWAALHAEQPTADVQPHRPAPSCSSTPQERDGS